ncbi:MAG: CerR family C-terminal domain-containing protein [Acidaminococcaceae bacterium]|nr:CerR family C-terminal domain-containing protein [Acidaminococcaceae bacterium]
MRKLKIRDESVELRGDGRETREKIIECAGKLIARQGYAKTTSKQICEKAKVNIAAVNYHFGSRDGLYLVLLETAHDYLVEMEDINRIQAGNLSSSGKMEKLVEMLADNAFHKNSWHIQVWLREILNPTPLLQQVVSGKAMPKLNVIKKIFSEYTGFAEDDPMLFSCMLSLAAPFMVMMVGKNSKVVTELLQKKDAGWNKQLAEGLKKQALAHLAIMKK